MKKTKIKLIRYAGDRFIEIVLFNNKEELRIALKNKKVLGQYSPELFAVYPKIKVGKKLGTIYLNRENIGVGVLSHEVLHCVFDWYDKIHHGGFLETPEDQEKACWLQGDIVRRIALWLIKIKAWK